MLSIVFAGMIGGAPSVPPTAFPSPTVSRCALGTTQRVSFRVDNAPREALGSFVRISLYIKKNEWIADEIVFTGIDAPIPPIAGLLNPDAVAKASCAFDGYVSTMDQRGFVENGHLPTGRKSCPQRDGLNVDGGPDAAVDSIVFGRDWILIQLGLDINHFLPNQPTSFEGDVFRASIDNSGEEKVVVSGADPQTVSFLFTDLKPGFHQVNYGPWFASDVAEGFTPGYHNVCVAI